MNAAGQNDTPNAQAALLISLVSAGCHQTAQRKLRALDRHEVGEVSAAILDVLWCAATKVVTPLGQGLLWRSIAEREADDTASVDTRRAAKLVLFHSAITSDDEDMADIGYAAMNSVVEGATAFSDRMPELVTATIVSWLDLVPMLKAAGVDKLIETFNPQRAQ